MGGTLYLMNKEEQEEAGGGAKNVPEECNQQSPVTRTPQGEGGGGVKNVTKECSMMMSAIRPTPTRTAGEFEFDMDAKTWWIVAQ